MPNLKPTKKAPLKKQAPMRLTEKSFNAKFYDIEKALFKKEMFYKKRSNELAEKFATENLKLQKGKIYTINIPSSTQYHKKRYLIERFGVINVSGNVIITVSGILQTGSKLPNTSKLFMLKSITRQDAFRKINEKTFPSIFPFVKLKKCTNQKKFN